MAKATGRESDQFNLRLPDGMRDRLKEAAAHANRSLNAEIIARLEDSFVEETDELKDWLYSQAEEADRLRETINKQDNLLQQFRITNRNFIILSKAVGQALLEQEGTSDFLKTLAAALISFENDEQSMDD